jgi:glycosyltransferase involved in cell wall biosynthesis
MVSSRTARRALQVILERLVTFSERAAHAIAIVSPSMRNVLVSRGIEDRKIYYVPNPVDEVLFAPRPRNSALRDKMDWNDRLVVMYAGAMGEVQGLNHAVEAMNHLKGSRILLTFLGSGHAEEALRRRATDLGLDSVRFLGRVDPLHVSAYMAAADVQLVSLRQHAFLERTTPSKIATIMASALPIAGSIAGDGARLIEQAGAGLVAPPASPRELAQNLLRFLEQPELVTVMGRAGFRYYQAHLSTDAIAPKIEDLLKQIAASH